MLSRTPAPADTDVPVNATVSIRFSTPLDAHVVDASDLRLFAGFLPIPGKLRVDHLDRTLSFTAIELLRENLEHTVLLRGNIRAFDGSYSGREQSYSFKTGTREAPPAPPGRPVDPLAVAALFEGRCARCHSGNSAPMGVDLSSAERTMATLVGVGSATGELRVVAGDHAKSYLLRKTEGLWSFLGSRMPPDAPPLAADELRLMAHWIDDLPNANLN